MVRYRAVALTSLRAKIDPSDSLLVLKYAKGADIRQSSVRQKGPGGSSVASTITFLDGKDVSKEIREPAVSAAASKVACHQKIRNHLVGLQQRMGSAGGIVAEGR